jgi:hypothetical protein
MSDHTPAPAALDVNPDSIHTPAALREWCAGLQAWFRESKKLLDYTPVGRRVLRDEPARAAKAVENVWHCLRRLAMFCRTRYPKGQSPPASLGEAVRQLDPVVIWCIEQERELTGATPAALEQTGESAFVPAKICRGSRVTSHKQLMALLGTVPNDEHGIRRHHRGQHLFVHAGDWHRWLAEQKRQEFEVLDRAIPEVEAEIAAMRRKKSEKMPKKPRTK